MVVGQASKIREIRQKVFPVVQVPIWIGTWETGKGSKEERRKRVRMREGRKHSRAPYLSPSAATRYFK
jgi:hypothetical protein